MHIYLIRTVICSAMLWLSSSGAWAISLTQDRECCREDFAAVKKLGDKELDGMRGGFITSNGMQIDFSLVTRTLVDNTILQETVIDSRTLDTIDPNSLRTIVQVGDQNISALSAIEALQNPGVISVVQNTLNDKVIQSLNLLDVNVTNVANFNLQTLVPMINNQAVEALR